MPDAICSKENYRRCSLPGTCCRCGLTHNSPSHCQASGSLQSSVTIVVMTTTGSNLTPSRSLSRIKKKTDQGTNVIPRHAIEEEGTIAQKVRKTHLIIKISNTSSRIHTICSPVNSQAHTHRFRRLCCPRFKDLLARFQQDSPKQMLQIYLNTDKHSHTEVITDLHTRLPQKSQ